MNASPRQTFALFCATGKDWRSQNLTAEMASAILSAIQNVRGDKPAALAIANKIIAGETVEVAPAGPSMQQIWAEANAAGMKAGRECIPMPMVVGQPTTLLGNDVDPNKEHWFVSEGACGFAWVHISPARGPFVSWCKKNELGHNAYKGGWDIWIGEFGQSIARKEAYAAAAAEVLRKYGINAYANSRLD